MEQNNNKRRIFGLIVLLAIIGAIAVWAYSNYNKSDQPNKIISNPSDQAVQEIQQQTQQTENEPVTSTKCGDGICGATELVKGKVYCEKDCIPQCGNGICEENEDYRNCGDCEEYVVDICGNGMCEPDAENPETVTTCPSDCSA